MPQPAQSAAPLLPLGYAPPASDKSRHSERSAQRAAEEPPYLPPRSGSRSYFPAPKLSLARATLIGVALYLAPSTLHAQMSLPTAVDLALRNNPRIKIAQADVARARAQLSQTNDVYIPSLSAGAGIGYAYGYSPYPPTLFTFNGGSLLYNPSQIFYIRSARAGVDAAQHSYDEARDAVGEDTAQAFLALQHSQQRLAVITEQTTFAAALVSIVQARLDAGHATAIDLTQAKLTAANLHLALLHAEDDVASDRDHLARIMGVGPGAVAIDNTFPATPAFDPNASPESESRSPAVASAYANALARQQQAIGDAKFRFRPVVNFAVQYNRYATFTESFHSLNQQYGNQLTANEYLVGLQITIPLYDRYREAKARETAANASHDLHEAENAKLNALDAQSRLQPLSPRAGRPRRCRRPPATARAAAARSPPHPAPVRQSQRPTDDPRRRAERPHRRARKVPRRHRRRLPAPHQPAPAPARHRPALHLGPHRPHPAHAGPPIVQLPSHGPRGSLARRTQDPCRSNPIHPDQPAPTRSTHSNQIKTLQPDQPAPRMRLHGCGCAPKSVGTLAVLPFASSPTRKAVKPPNGLS